MSDYWALPHIWRNEAPPAKPRREQTVCVHRWAWIINPFAGWRYVCLDCGMKTR